MNDTKQRFLKIYADLPLGVRKEIVLTLNDKPMTWDVVFIEVNNDTALSKTILGKLEKLGII